MGGGTTIIDAPILVGTPRCAVPTSARIHDRAHEKDCADGVLADDDKERMIHDYLHLMAANIIQVNGGAVFINLPAMPWSAKVQA
jgi:hypothetical protein